MSQELRIAWLGPIHSLITPVSLIRRECWKTGWATRAERSMLRVLEGGCSVPVGCETTLVEINPTGHANGNGTTTPSVNGIGRRLTRATDPHAAKLTLHGTITSLSGTKAVLSSISRQCYSLADVEKLGADVAAELIEGGGREILEELGKHVKEVAGDQDGVEIAFESNGRAAVNIPPASAKERRGSMGQALSPTRSSFAGLAKSPTSTTHRTVFKEGTQCLRPAAQSGRGW